MYDSKHQHKHDRILPGFGKRLRQGGYVFTRVCLLTDYSKTIDQTFMTFYGIVGTNRLDFDLRS